MDLILLLAFIWFAVWVSYRVLSRVFNTYSYRERQRKKYRNDIRRRLPPWY